MKLQQNRGFRRFGFVAALAGLCSTLFVVIGPAAAHASPIGYFCQTNPPEASDSLVFISDKEEGADGKDWIQIFTFYGRDVTFDPGKVNTDQNNVIINNEQGTTPITRTITNSRSTTKSTSLTTSTSTVVNLSKIMQGLNETHKLDRTVSSSVTEMTSSQETFITSPMTAERIELGVFGYNVRYNVRTYVLHEKGTRCEYRGDKSGDVSAYVPSDTGWNRTVLPRINYGGIIKASDSSYTIRNCDIVSAYGQFFPPSRVIVRQSSTGRQWAPIGPGSAWWYDSPTQINVTLPCDMLAGDDVSVAVSYRDPFGRTIEGLPKYLYIYP